MSTRLDLILSSGLLVRIERGETVSASRDWTALVDLAAKGALDVRRSANGQLEYLYLGVPVKVGP